eukprot:979750-Rhodomonas_salina.1
MEGGKEKERRTRGEVRAYSQVVPTRTLEHPVILRHIRRRCKPLRLVAKVSCAYYLHACSAMPVADVDFPELDLWCAKLTDDELARILNKLKHNSRIQVVDFSRNEAGSLSRHALNAVISENTVIKHLKLSGSIPADRCAHAMSVSDIGYAAARRRSGEGRSSSNQFCIEGSIIRAKGAMPGPDRARCCYQENNTLESLELECNWINDAGPLPFLMDLFPIIEILSSLVAAMLTFLGCRRRNRGAMQR